MPEATAIPSILPKGFTLPAVTLPEVLPTDVAALTALLLAQQQAHDASHTKALDYINYLFEQFLLARRRMFGASSEQLSAQGRLFDEAEALAFGTTEEQDVVLIPAQQIAPEVKDKPARGKRGPLPAELERVEIVHDVPQSQRSCCGTPMEVIGQDVSEQLDIVPMQVRVLRHIRLRYGCATSIHAPVTAALPPQPLPKSNASADFLAMMLTVKFVDGLPLTRFGKVLDRHHAPVPVQTLARWTIASAQVLQPLLIWYAMPCGMALLSIWTRRWSRYSRSLTRNQPPRATCGSRAVARQVSLSSSLTTILAAAARYLCDCCKAIRAT